MAKQDRLEKVAKKAFAEAEKAIAAAVTAAKDLGKATRKNAAALVARLEDGIAEVTGVPANGATADKAKDAEKATKAEKVKKAKKSDKAKTEKPAAQTTTTVVTAPTKAPTKAATKAAAAAVKAKAPTVRSKTAAPATTTEPTVAQLRAQAKAAGFSGYSRLTRAELVALLAGGKDK